MKLWKKRKKVPIKTFILEQMVIEGCKTVSRKTIEPQLNSALEYLEANIATKKILDPTNSQNVISNELSIEQKIRIKKLAKQALNYNGWHEVFF